MSFEERITWTTGVVQLAVGIWYMAAILQKAVDTPVAAMEYRGELMVLVIAVVVLTTVGAVALAVGSVGWAMLTGKPVDVDLSDERDKTIARYAGNIGGIVLAMGVVPALGLTIFEFDHFWIAHALLASFFASEMVETGLKLAAYRRGF